MVFSEASKEDCPKPKGLDSPSAATDHALTIPGFLWAYRSPRVVMQNLDVPLHVVFNSVIVSIRWIWKPNNSYEKSGDTCSSFLN